MKRIIELGLPDDEKLALAAENVNARRPESTADPYTLRVPRETGRGSGIIWQGGGTLGHWLLDRSLRLMTVEEIADATIESIEHIQRAKRRAMRLRRRGAGAPGAAQGISDS